MSKWRLTIVVLTMGLVLAAAASVQAAAQAPRSNTRHHHVEPVAREAIAWNTAFNLSFNQNWYNCYNRTGDGFYTCNIPDYETPVCNGTGLNKRGVAQWDCNSAYVQNPVYPGIPIVGSPRICRENDPWDPYGSHVSGGSITCSNIGGVG